MINNENLALLYGKPFPSTRTGALFNAFSYPTKISPEAIALFIACHTNVGDTVFDPFGGSGTTGIAVKLCDKPSPELLKMAKQYGVSPVWGYRKAIIYELSPIASAIGNVMCNTSSKLFVEYATKLIDEIEAENPDIYNVIDSDGEEGTIRYIIWTDGIICPNCGKENKYSDVAIKYSPIEFIDKCTCRYCNVQFSINEALRSHGLQSDPVLNCKVDAKFRYPFKIYGTTGKKKWSRLATNDDWLSYQRMIEKLDFSDVPIQKIQWGELYRTGYHFGIEHIHQFYTLRNVFVLSKLWKKVSEYPANIQQALKVFLLSYNQSHSTLMTRVVAKKNNKDFVLTGAQPGVLYISSLPVEKNILDGLRRKIKTFSEGIKILESSTSEVCFVSGSSVSTSIASNSIDYVFTDPPFGGYIPYSEINQINELWYGVKTDVSDEVIINRAQGKSLIEYQKLMSKVFAEISRCIKVNGQCTVVFHSAKSAIWRAIIKAYQTNGFSVSKTGILDKVQASFKQVNSTITVKGDPLILLAKRTKCTVKENYASDVCIAEQILKSHQSENKGKEKSERMFSEYIAECIEKGITITLDAEYFFNHE